METIQAGIKEQHNYDNASRFQREVADMLKQIGYEYRYNLEYQLNDSYVDVSRLKNIKDLFQTAYNNGAQDKVWEIKRVLEC
jgi:hypothetical protein